MEVFGLQMGIALTFASYYQLDKTPKDVSIHEVEVGTRDSMSELETMRRIDAGILSYKHILLTMAILLISVSMYFFQQQNFPF